MARNYWLDLFTGKTWEEFIDDIAESCEPEEV